VTAPPGVFVHPAGLCESDQVGPGTRVWAFAHVLAGARVGADCNICDHAYVESGAVLGDRVTVKNAVLVFDRVTVGDDAFLGPNVVFTNDYRPRAHVKKGHDALLPTTVETGVTLGANVTVVCGLMIGAHAFVAAGTVVTRDVPAHALLAGNPGRRIGWACVCGEALPADLTCSCGRAYRPDHAGLVLIEQGVVAVAGGVADAVGLLALERDDLLQPRAEGGEVVALAGVGPHVLGEGAGAGEFLDQRRGELASAVVGAASLANVDGEVVVAVGAGRRGRLVEQPAEARGREARVDQLRQQRYLLGALLGALGG